MAEEDGPEAAAATAADGKAPEGETTALETPRHRPDITPIHPESQTPVSAAEPRRRLTFPKDVPLNLPPRPQRLPGVPTIAQLRSHTQSPFRSYMSSGAVTPTSRLSHKPSVSSINLQHLLEKLEMDQYDTYGVEELRDGFFDASFFRPAGNATTATTAVYKALNSSEIYPSFSFYGLAYHFYAVNMDFLWQVFRTHYGIKLFKSLLAYTICFIVCLVSGRQSWLGKHNYFAAISVLLNHPGRTFGAQIDGTFLCILGAAVGLGWGCLSLKFASFIPHQDARREALVEILLVIFVGTLAWFRSTLIRLYQALMSAGIAVFFLCLVEPSLSRWDYETVREFAFPWLVGQAICLLVNIIVFPGAGGREVATALHDALLAAMDGLVIPRPDSPADRLDLNMRLVNLSEAYRDMRSEITLSSFLPDDICYLRNTLQSVMKDLIAVDTSTTLFEEPPPSVPSTASGEEVQNFIPIDIDTPAAERGAFIDLEDTLPALTLVRGVLAPVARELIDTMLQMLSACDIELMAIAGYPQLPAKNKITCNVGVVEAYAEFKDIMDAFDIADESLIDHPLLPNSFSKHPELVSLFLFAHPLRQAANSVDVLAQRVLAMRARPNARKKKLLWPSYPWKKAFYRSNTQVRHDRGGVTAGYYFRSKKELDAIMGAGAVVSEPHQFDKTRKSTSAVSDIFNSDAASFSGESHTKRYHVWRAIHRMQGFETRFAIKLAVVISFLSFPAWLNRSTGWYKENESWWAVIGAWFMFHPRVGGNAEDMAARSIAAVLGSVWGGVTYAAGNGNPYVMTVMAALFMFPALFRYTQSEHPRSGLMACMSFSVVSLSAYTHHGYPNVAHIAWTRGLAIMVGICAAVLVNWTLWPFVARHELRKSISTMMLTLAVTYSGIVAKYIYHEEDMEPTREDIERSQVLEAKLREGFVRMRELIEMTRHEIRLRGPFDPTPYYRLIETLERFLEHLVQVRQSSLIFQPSALIPSPDDDNAKDILSFRRDAVASILMNLYTMAAGLRVKKPIPKYLPSAAVARKMLLDKMEEAELDTEEERVASRRRRRGAGPGYHPDHGRGGGVGGGDGSGELYKRWADVYQFAYSSALTDIVGELEELERLTKEVCGEMPLDVPNL